jgi:hypothetical protein
MSTKNLKNATRKPLHLARQQYNPGVLSQRFQKKPLRISKPEMPCFAQWTGLLECFDTSNYEEGPCSSYLQEMERCMKENVSFCENSYFVTISSQI